MKKLSFLLIALYFVSQGFSQTPVMKFLTTHDKTDITNGSHTVEGDAARFVISEAFYTIMTGVDSVLVGAKRIEKQFITGTSDYFCWKECYLPRTAGTLKNWIASDSLMMYDGDTVKLYSVYLEPDGNMGTAKYDYIFTPKGFETDTTFVEIVFDILTIGIDEQSVTSIKIHPNPASDYVRVELNEQTLNNVQGRIISLSGQVILKFVFKENANVDVSSLNPGMYFIEIQDNKGIVARERLSIK